MPANVALTPTELANLANQDQLCPYYLSYKAENTIATATVATTPSGSSFNTLDVSGTSNWSNIRDGMSAKITSSDGTVLRGYYRVRGNLGGTTKLLIEEITTADPGIIAASVRTSGIITTDLITVTDRFDLYSMKPRISNGTIYQDYDIPVGTHNTQPEVIVNIAINSEPGDYITMINSNGGTKTITAVASIVKWPTSSGSTVGYAWIVPGSWTNVSGTGTNTLTADVPPGDYTLYLDVTDSIGGTTEVCRWVRIHSPADPPLGVNITSDLRDMNTRKVSIRAVQAVIGSVPPGSKVALWTNSTWGGADVATATKKFIGFLYQQPFKHEPNYYETNADIYSISAILDTLMCYPATLKYAGTPITWEELAPTLQTVQFVMLWVLRWRCANLLKCFNFTPFSTSGTTGRKINIGISQGSVMSALKALADMYDVNVGSRSDGEIISQSLPWMLSDRSGVATRCTLVNNIYTSITPNWMRHTTTGSVLHDGVHSDLTTDTPISAQAPGLQIFGEGSHTDRRSNKIYESQDDANSRVGFAFAYLNSQYPQIDVEIWNNWDVFEPADCNIVTIVVPASKSPTGASVTIDCVPSSVDKTWIGGRRARIKLSLTASTNGLGAQTVPPQPQTPIASLPPITSARPDFPAIDDGGGSVPIPITSLDGNYLFPANSSSVYWGEQIVNLTTPQFNLITPAALSPFQVTSVAIDFNPAFGAVGGAVLGNNSGGTQSIIFHSSQLSAIAPTYTTGTVFDGNYQVLRSASADQLLAYSPTSSGGSAILYDFSGTDGGWVLLTNPPDPGRGTWIMGQGWVNNCTSPSSPYNDGITIRKSFGTVLNVVAAIATYSATEGQNDGSNGLSQAMILENSGVDQGRADYYPPGQFGTNKRYVLQGNFQADAIRLGLDDASHNASCPTPGTAVLKSVLLVLGGGGASVRYSPDNGMSIGSVLNVGTVSPGGVGGFDVSRNSGVSYAAGAGTVFKASSLGGAYSNFYAISGNAQAVCCHIPYYNWSGSDQTNSATPDVIVALGVPDGSSRSLLWVEGGGSVHDITPHAGIIFDSADCVTSHGATHIMCFGRVSGLSKVYATDDKGTTWRDVTPSNFTSPTWIGRRRNNTVDNRGQVYILCDQGIYYSSYWAASGHDLKLHNTPATLITADCVW